MKKYLAEILALLLSMNAITPLEGNENHLPRMGQEIVSQVEAEYKQGKYSNFLNQLHGQYQSAGKIGAIRGLFQTAKKGADDDVIESLDKKQAELDQIRNQRLMEAIAENPNSEIAKKIQSIISLSERLPKFKILRELEQLKYQGATESTNPLESKISAIETEYYLKSLLLDIAGLRSDTSIEERYKKKIVLSLEKFQKIEAIVNASKDSAWKEKLRKMKKAHHDYLALCIDLETLNDLAKGKIDAHNPTEEKVKEIMMDFLKQKNAS